MRDTGTLMSTPKLPQSLVSFDEFGLVEGQDNEELVAAMQGAVEAANQANAPNTLRGYAED